MLSEQIRALLRTEGPVTQAIFHAADDILKSMSNDQVLRKQVSRIVDEIANQSITFHPRQTLEERIYYYVQLSWSPYRHRRTIWACHFVAHRLLSCTSVFILVLLAANASAPSLNTHTIWENVRQGLIALFGAVIVLTVIDLLNENQMERYRQLSEKRELATALRDAVWYSLQTTVISSSPENALAR